MCSLLKSWDPAVPSTNANWAQIGTQEHSPLGKGSVTMMNDADVWYMTPKEVEVLINTHNPIRKCLVIRKSWDDVSNDDNIERFLQCLTIKFGSGSVEVQDLSGDSKHPKQIRCRDYVQTLRTSQGKQVSLSKDSLPLNLLNLKATPITGEDVFSTIISAHYVRFDLLDTLCQRAEGTLKQKTFKPGTDHIPPSNAGKAKRHPIIHGREIDLQSCLTFGLFAQRGSYSGWHVDVLNGTYVTCKAGLKAWFIHQHPLTEAEVAAFTEAGQYWQPDPSRVMLILLRPGDTLYIPAGELVPHAPITVTDCLMRGGMVWDTLRFHDILSNTLLVIENNDITNEPIPAQLVACWDELENIVQNESHLIELVAERIDTRMQGDTLMGGEDNAEEAESFSAFFDNVTTRMKAALSCNCNTRACTLNSCRCLEKQASNHRCNAWCHPNVRKNHSPRPCMI